jgi:hypothetical protein
MIVVVDGLRSLTLLLNLYILRAGRLSLTLTDRAR